MHVGTAAGLGLLVLCGGCATSTPGNTSATKVVLFQPQVRKVRVAAQLLRDLQELGARLVEDLAPRYRVIAPSALQAHLKTRRTMAQRQCRSRGCQARVGHKHFGATRAIAAVIETSLVAHCTVDVELRDLVYRGHENARTAGTCDADELRRAFVKAVCRLLPSLGSEHSLDHCLAVADFAWHDQLASTDRIRAKGSARERLLAERLLELKRGYEQHASGAIPTLSVAARCRIGALYDHIGNSITAEEDALPRGATKRAEHARQLEEARRQRAAPYVAKAKELYRACLAQAQAQQAHSRYTEQAQLRLAALSRIN